MDAYDRCTNYGGKNLADIVAIYVRGRELFRPPMYMKPLYFVPLLGLLLVNRLTKFTFLIH